MPVSLGKLRTMYQNMATTRAFEETAMRLFSLGKVHGTAHFCIGEEATAAGVCAAISPAISSTPRTAGTDRASPKAWT